MTGLPAPEAGLAASGTRNHGSAFPVLPGMNETPCCSAAVSCPEPLEKMELLRSSGEECFCVDAAGLAQGHGVFRTDGLDVTVEYVDGARLLDPSLERYRLVLDEGAFGVVPLAVLAAALLGRARGLRALGVVLASSVTGIAGYALGGAVGLVLLLVLGPVLGPGFGYGAGGFLVLVGLLTSIVTFLGATRALLRRGAASPGWTAALIAVGLVCSALLVAARQSDEARAMDALGRAPTPVTRPASAR